ncbi:MAG: 23S rRNA (guanosine(2251)-2'-O)-methyltransferase RlmB [Actinomycetaceae bacterium]|nr:23S rRNA (guanosine(2251)-2'-O)-methyltransferase RlmB [Arcanobacterium sp.]MDD7505604.1 23S rRNA (guanosine(2251)-2'-O)-methyltransferase RlmB [Actinomycetaceae bacterium]MDY6143241.1 23S rRNA (guanosine(2251)-2'-O)-methyltransferase RlmB [Arcanobacterium sp.]
MAGNSHFGRPGAVRKGKKATKVGSGGQRRARLEGKGPTPKAEDRTYHPAYKRKKEAEARAAAEAARAASSRLRRVLQLPESHELIAGRNPVYEAVNSGVPYARVFMVASLANDDRVSAVAAAAAQSGAPVVEVTRHELDRMTDGASHQGIAVEVPPYEYANIEDLVDAARDHTTPGLIVALDSVTDPHNLGAVLRSGAAFGADGVLIPERRSASMNVTAWKVSAGAAARIPVARETNLVRSLEDLKSQGYFVVGLAGEDGAVPISELELFDTPLVIVTGSEGKGLSRLVRQTCDVIAQIPIAGAVESLNASVATGIALYQVAELRRRS